MLGHLSVLGSKPPPPPACGMKRERSQSLESTVTEQVLGVLDPCAVEAAEMLFSLKAGKRERSASLPSPGTSRQEEDEVLLQPEERSSSSSGSACSELRAPCKALCVTSTSKLVAPLATRSYVWRGPKRSLLNQGLASSCPGQAALSSDPDEEDECGGAGQGTVRGAGLAMASGSNPVGSNVERADRDKEWAALTTWLRMNLHHPRTAKREVLFLGKHVDGRGWHFFLNPALAWSDVSPETKMRLRTLPQETELAFMRKYPGKHGRDWVKKTQKYRPPGCSVTYSVPLADMVYSLTAIYYRFEGRPGTGASAASRAAAAAADPSDEARVALNPHLSLSS